MGLELIRSQVRDRGSPYAGLGESHGMLFLEIGDPDIGGGNYPSGWWTTTASGNRSGTLVIVLFRVGFGLAAHRGRPGGVRDYGTTTTSLWECRLAQVLLSALAVQPVGPCLGTPRYSHRGILV